MAADPCNPLADPQLPAEVLPHHHHAVHHVVGRIRHRIHHSVLHARPAAAPVSDACGKPEAILGQPGGLPAAPAGRLPGTSALRTAAGPKAALSGGAAKAAAAMLGLASAAGVAGTGAVLVSAAKPVTTNSSAVAVAQPGQPASSVATPSTGSPSVTSAPPAIPPPGAHSDNPKPGGTAVPEPSSAALFILAAAAALAARWRFGRRAARSGVGPR